MNEFAQMNIDVVFVENTGIRSPRLSDAKRLLKYLSGFNGNTKTTDNERSNVKVVKPLVLPPTNLIFRFLNRAFFIPRLSNKIRKIVREEKIDVGYVYLPTATSLDLLKDLNPRSVVYDCVSNFGGHPSAPVDILDTEERLVKISNLVLTDSDFLYDKMTKKHRNVNKIHHGVNLRKLSFHSYSSEISYGSACYFGTINDKLDFESIYRLAESGVKVTLIGKKQREVSNGIEYLEPMDWERLMSTLSAYDAFLIPYKSDEFMKGVIPAKIYECLYFGKPILYSGLYLPAPLSRLMYYCEGPEEYVTTWNGLKSTETRTKITERRELARAQSTQKNASTIIDWIIHSKV
ncbi:glycosyltransferase family protein [Alicyclobacillus dauci]|uniref:Uncharacterized protein n=1 Tax=Alicyclobacillus dauci TaxID=1475485 RepID=A0ABY6Z1W9_9BACL|nr:hypothetical protein [Alicyclobacillus dauci]WAH36826.1 hypothetical protein NZD86_22090 [Alicyclobacillus dauci]